MFLYQYNRRFLEYVLSIYAFSLYTIIGSLIRSSDMPKRWEIFQSLNSPSDVSLLYSEVGTGDITGFNSMFY